MTCLRSTTVVGAVALVLGVAGCRRSAEEVHEQRALSVAGALQGADVAGFARADAPRPFEFPADHGPHPDFRTEWWYFTGNLAAADGRRFGYHLTFFRVAVAPPGTESSAASAWRTRQVWMAHFAVLDVAGDRVHSAERFARGALGLAGARAQPFRVWLEDWEARSSTVGGFLPLRIAATDGDVAIDLELRPGRPPVLHGDAGLSRKGAEPGNASYYYSFMRVPVGGTLRIDGRDHEVRGLGWIDREWSTSALDEDQVGWDWFSIQLDDGRDLMWYRMRRRDGSIDPASAGTLVEADGTVRRLGSSDVELEPRGEWGSPRSGVRYPVDWRLRVPSAALDLEIVPRRRDQELNLSFRYWEGAIVVRGSATGAGYLEMTGY